MVSYPYALITSAFGMVTGSKFLPMNFYSFSPISTAGSDFGSLPFLALLSLTSLRVFVVALGFLSSHIGSIALVFFLLLGFTTTVDKSISADLLFFTLGFLTLGSTIKLESISNQYGLSSSSNCAYIDFDFFAFGTGFSKGTDFDFKMLGVYFFYFLASFSI